MTAAESDRSSANSRAPIASSPLAESPWFWLMIFGLAALIGGALIAPKYSQRMDRVERMHDARMRAYVERVGGEVGETPSAMHREVSIRELLIFVAIVLLGGGAVGRWCERRQARRAAQAPSEAGHP